MIAPPAAGLFGGFWLAKSSYRIMPHPYPRRRHIALLVFHSRAILRPHVEDFLKEAEQFRICAKMDNCVAENLHGLLCLEAILEQPVSFSHGRLWIQSQRIAWSLIVPFWRHRFTWRTRDYAFMSVRRSTAQQVAVSQRVSSEIFGMWGTNLSQIQHAMSSAVGFGMRSLRSV